MSKKRSFALFFFCASVPILWSGIIEGEWPDHSPTRWAIFIGGLVVIGVVLYVVESRTDPRRDDPAGDPSDERTP